MLGSFFGNSLLTGKDDCIVLVTCNAQKTPEDQNRYFTGFLLKKTEVGHALPGKTASGENRWTRHGMPSVSRHWT